MSNEMATERVPQPDLDEDILVLEEWDRLRKKADDFRRQGIESLWRCIDPESAKSDATKEEGDWVKEQPQEKQEPQDLICPALIFHAASREFVRKTKVSPYDFLLSQPPESQQLLRKIRTLSNPEDLGSDKSERADALLKSFIDVDPQTARVPIFQASRVLQALLCAPETVFSYPAVLAYYIVVRELSTVHYQKPILGSARSREGSEPTAFLTSECARAIKGMARALSGTADLIEKIMELSQEWRQLESALNVPERWKTAEKKRIVLAAFNDIAIAARKGAIGLREKVKGDKGDKEEDITELLKGVDLPGFLMKFCQQFESSAQRAKEGIQLAKTAIDKRHAAEKFADAFMQARANLSHQVACKTIEDANVTAKNAAEAVDAMKVITSFSKDASDDALKKSTEDVNKLVENLRSRAAAVERLLESTTMYLTSVIDREIQKEPTGQLNAGELAFAAASYAALVKPELDPRLDRATRILCQAISIDGTFATSSVLDTDEHGYNAIVMNSEIHRAFAYLLQKVQVEVATETFRRLVGFFESRAVLSHDNQVIGWPHDHAPKPIKAARWTSALAILSLDRIKRMLDARINQRVFRHFSVIKHEDLKDLRKTPKLKELFYPDYGLSSHGRTTVSNTMIGHKDLEEQSVAQTLERMRSHIQGSEEVPGYDKEDDCFSLILFGPSGTGKTTLVESLAATSKVHFVEITPSDFLVSGGAMIEKRARHVMRALSFLSQAVVLFDEFDPIVRSRDQGSSLPLNEFAFVTPGMLPKLKWLHDCAKKRQVAYCLITNRIGELDQAAVRSGRFDRRIGIYTPDLLSRVGRLVHVASKHMATQNGKIDDNHLKRITMVVKKCEGQGMTALGKPGNFSPAKKDKSPPKNSVHAYIFLQGEGYTPPGKDAELDDPPAGQGTHHNHEVHQLSWVQIWDEDFAGSNWEDVLSLLDKGPEIKKVEIKIAEVKEKVRKKNLARGAHAAHAEEPAQARPQAREEGPHAKEG